MSSPTNSLIQISIIKNDIRTLPSQLERDRFQIGFSSRFHDLTPYEGASRERDFFDLHMGRDGGSGGGSVSGEEVENAWRETGFLDQCAHADGCEWGEFGGLNEKIEKKRPFGLV